MPVGSAGGGFEIPAGTVVLETAVDFQQVDRDLRELEERGQEAGKAAGAGFEGGFGEGAKKGKKQVDGLRKALDETEKKAGKAAEKLGATESQADDLGETASIAGEGLLGMAAIMGTKVAKGAASAAAHLVTLSVEGVERVGNATERAGVKLQESSEDMLLFGDVANGVGKTLEFTGGAAEKLAANVQELKKALVAAAAAGFAESVRRADNFQESFNKVLTVLPEGTQKAGLLKAELNEMAAQTRQSAEAASNTLFKVLTRMPRLTEDTDKALSVVRTGLEAQSTGFVEATDAVAAYEAVLQGFQLEASDAKEISDLLFLAQRRAGVQFDKIANSVGDVASLTNALEGEFRDLLAVYSTLVPTGQSVSEINTQLRGVMSGIIDPTSEAAEAQKELGLELSAQKVRSEGLLGVIEEIIEATEGNPEQISRLFGSQEAITLLVTLAQRMDKLNQEQREFIDASGEAEKVSEQMGSSIGAELSDIGTDLAAIARTVGGVFQPAVQGFFSVIAAGTELLRTLNDEFFRWLQGVQELDRTQPRIPFVEDLSAINLQQIRAVREAQLELGIIDEERFRELEKKFADEGRRAGEAFAEGLSEEAQAFEAMEGMAAALRRERVERLRDPDITQGRQPPEIERPELPADPEFLEERAQQIRDLGRARAQAARMAGRSEGVVQAILTENQRRLNRFVETQVERLRNHDVEERKLLGLLQLWEEIEVSTEGVRRISDETAQSIEEGMAESAARAQREFEAANAAITDIGPIDLGLDEDQQLSEFDRKIRTLRRRLDDLAAEGELNFENVQSAVRDTGLTLEQLREAGEGSINALVRAIIRYKQEQEDADEGTEQLAEDLSKIASVASGILNAAEAMGELDDETRQALQSVTALIQAGSQIASGNIVAGLTQGLGALGNLAAALTGPSDREKVMAENTEALLELRQDIDKLRSVLSSTSGEVLELRDDFASFVERIPDQFGPLPEGALPEDRPFGTEDTDLFGEPEATKGEVQQALSDIGISFSELRELADRFGVSIEFITKAMKEGEASADGVRQEFIDLNEAMQELKLEELFAGFSGQMQKLETQFELMDVEDPIEKLEAIRQKFLEFADVPPALESALAGADLSTAEGRQRFEQAVQGLFQRLAAGELTAEQLGGLTPQQFREMLTRMEGLVDEAAGEEGAAGATTSFQVSRQITEVTANRLTATMTTLSVLARQRNRILTAIATALGASIPDRIRPPSREEIGRAAGGGAAGGTSVQMVVQEGAVQFMTTGPLTREDGRRAADGFMDEMDRRFELLREDEARRRGGRNREF